MRAILAIAGVCLIASLAAGSAGAQAPRVKTGYEVPGPTCYIRLETGRIRPIHCNDLRLVFARASSLGGSSGGDGNGGAAK